MPLGAPRAGLIRRPVSAVAAWEQLLDRATALGAEGLYDVTNPNTRTVSGGTVSQINDAMANLPALTQATTVEQPGHSEGATGGFDALTFDGTDDHIDTTVFSVALAQPVTWVFLFKWDALEANVLLDAIGSGDSHVVYGDWPAADLGELVVWIGNEELKSGAGGDLNWHVVLLEANGASTNMWLDDLQVLTNAAGGTNTQPGLRLGAAWDVTKHFDGQLGPVIIIEGLLSAGDRQDLIDLLHDLSSIPKA